MAIRINRVSAQGQYGNVLLEKDTETRRGAGEVKTYNVNDANTPEHIRDCWNRCK